MTLTQHLADADHTRRIEKQVAAFIRYLLAVLRQEAAMELEKIPTSDHGVLQSALTKLYDDAFREAQGVFDDAASDARAAIPSDTAIRDDWDAAVQEARREQRAE